MEFIIKDKRKEELQSRRQFFKKAAKSALPILGAIAIANMPLIAKATESTSNSCTYCGGGCKGCAGTCIGSCSDVCTGCSGLCQGTCKGMCYNSGK